jgi:hypothetical protein
VRFDVKYRPAFCAAMTAKASSIPSRRLPTTPRNRNDGHQDGAFELTHKNVLHRVKGIYFSGQRRKTPIAVLVSSPQTRTATITPKCDSLFSQRQMQRAHFRISNLKNNSLRVEPERRRD